MATYAQQGIYLASSDSVTQVVNQASTSTGFSVTPNPSVFGQPISLTASVSVVSPGGGTPAGTVTGCFPIRDMIASCLPHRAEQLAAEPLGPRAPVAHDTPAGT